MFQLIPLNMFTFYSVRLSSQKIYASQLTTTLGLQPQRKSEACVPGQPQLHCAMQKGAGPGTGVPSSPQ